MSWSGKAFVQSCGTVYGKTMLSYNVHALIHLVQDCKVFGCLDDFSAFQFENFMREILIIIIFVTKSKTLLIFQENLNFFVVNF